jgi:DnaJ-class molecular chaperone
MSERECYQCNGTGKEYEHGAQCWWCNGTGWVDDPETGRDCDEDDRDEETDDE